MSGPVPFEVHESGAFLHGTKADLEVGALVMPGISPNFNAVLSHVYFTRTLDAAAWGAELATGDMPDRIYIVEPTGAFEDDPNLTDKRFPGNPTLSFRSEAPVKVVGELMDWEGHSPEQVHARRNGLDELEARGTNTIID